MDSSPTIRLRKARVVCRIRIVRDKRRKVCRETQTIQLCPQRFQQRKIRELVRLIPFRIFLSFIFVLYELTPVVLSDTTLDKTVTRRPVGGPARSDVSLESSGDSNNNPNPLTKKGKPKPFSLLSRTRSIRDGESPREPSPKSSIAEPEPTYSPEGSLKTAPLPIEHDRSFRHMMNSTIRQRSEDRQPTMPRDRSQEKAPNEGSKLKGSRDNSRSQISREPHTNKRSDTTSFSSSFKESSGHAFLSNLKTSATKGAEALSKGLFGKGRTNSTTEKEPVEDVHYQLKVLNLPLVEQTRLTRISKKLEESRDKTEFWMPAFPWRAIDYLNYKGSDVEGLYRVPGSFHSIKKWEIRFDEGK